jgi:hypothetical protein
VVFSFRKYKRDEEQWDSFVLKEALVKLQSRERNNAGTYLVSNHLWHSVHKYKHFCVHVLIHILIFVLVFSVCMFSHSSMFSLFKDYDDFKTLLLTVKQTCGSAHGIFVRDKANRPSASCKKVVIIRSAIHLCLAHGMVFFSLRWYFLLVFSLLYFGALRFFV